MPTSCLHVDMSTGRHVDMSAHQHMDVVTFLQFEKNGRYQIDNREIIESWVDKITAHVLKHGRQLIIVVVSLTSIFVSLFITSTIPISEVTS